jgi:hypothetical protein
MRWNDRECDLVEMREQKRMLFFFPDELIRDSVERAFDEWEASVPCARVAVAKARGLRKQTE